MRQVVRKVLGSSSVKRLSLEFTHSPSTRPERKSHSPQQSSLSVEAPRKKREHSVAEGARIDAFPAQKKRSEKTPTKNSITEPLNSAASASASPDEAPTIPNTASIGRTVAIRRCEYILGYQFQNRFLLWEALHCTEPITPTFMTTERRFAEGNKRLAVVGDRVLDLLLTMKWYHTWEARSEHELHPAFIDCRSNPWQ